MKLIKICEVNDLVLGPLNFQTWPDGRVKWTREGEMEFDIYQYSGGSFVIILLNKF